MLLESVTPVLRTIQSMTQQDTHALCGAQQQQSSDVDITAVPFDWLGSDVAGDVSNLSGEVTLSVKQQSESRAGGWVWNGRDFVWEATAIVTTSAAKNSFSSGGGKSLSQSAAVEEVSWLDAAFLKEDGGNSNINNTFTRAVSGTAAAVFSSFISTPKHKGVKPKELALSPEGEEDEPQIESAEVDATPGIQSSVAATVSHCVLANSAAQLSRVFPAKVTSQQQQRRHVAVPSTTSSALLIRSASLPLLPSKLIKPAETEWETAAVVSQLRKRHKKGASLITVDELPISSTDVMPSISQSQATSSFSASQSAYAAATVSKKSVKRPASGVTVKPVKPVKLDASSNSSGSSYKYGRQVPQSQDSQDTVSAASSGDCHRQSPAEEYAETQRDEKVEEEECEYELVQSSAGNASASSSVAIPNQQQEHHTLSTSHSTQDSDTAFAELFPRTYRKDQPSAYGSTSGRNSSSAEEPPLSQRQIDNLIYGKSYGKQYGSGGRSVSLKVGSTKTGGGEDTSVAVHRAHSDTVMPELGSASASGWSKRRKLGGAK